MYRSFILIFLMAALVNGFGGSEDRFIKKYAMMKIYESCFGPEVVKQIRKEMKAACAKCATLEAPPPTPEVPTTTPVPTTKDQSQMAPLADPENSIYANQPQPFDPEKLHQAILAFRPQAQSPYPGPGGYPNRPFAGSSGFGGPGFYQGYGAPPAMYYPGGYPQHVPFAGVPYSFPFAAPQFLGSSRISRDMNIKDQLDALTSKLSGRVRNVTCVMQELGYLDENLEPNYEKISERIANLPINEELRRDMQDGVGFCQQFSQCVPEVKRDKSPLSKELIKPMFFFKCYKHKKLEACIMKDVREKYTEVGEDDFDDEVGIRRHGKDMKLDDKDIDDMATSMYEFLYGSEANLDLDSVF